MKKIITICLLVATAFTVNAQEIIKKEYIDSFLIESTMVNGKKNGTQKIYYKNGGIRAKSAFVDDSVEGVGTIYYESGKLEYETPYLNNKKEGVEKGYYENGKLKSTMVFEKGKANGLIKIFYENGNLKSQLEAHNGLRNGYDIQYNENGNIVKKQYWVNGNLRGILPICEGIDFIIKKLKNQEYEELDDKKWMNNNFDGIKNFTYDYFSPSSPNECMFTYLSSFDDSVYEQLVAELNTCKYLRGGREESKTEIRATFRYDKKTVVTLGVTWYKKEIWLKVSREAEKD